MAGLFVRWVYFDAPRTYLRYIKELTLALYSFFSMSYLIQTLFSPWRHDAVDLSRVPIRFWGQAIANNLISRVIGFILRFTVIVGGLVVLAFVNMSAVLFFIAWYLLPVVLIYSVIYGFSLLGGAYV